MKLGIVATHPIQYQVPWFQRLALQPGIELTVYYSGIPSAQQQGAGFGVAFQWDIPMLEGYAWAVVETCPKRIFGWELMPSNIMHIATTFARDKLEAVIITGWRPRFLWQALLASMCLSLPRIVRGESNALRVRPWWIRLGHRLLLSRYTAFLAIGQSNHRFYLQNGVRPARIFSAPYFVDNDRFVRQSERLRAERAKVRERWDIPENSVCFLYVGKLIRKKRIFDLLEAVKIVCGTGMDIHLLVTGAGELLSNAHRIAREHHLPVNFTGFMNQSEIAAAYVAADCLVLPSDYGETWGLVVNEAMACGLPAIVSDRVGCGAGLIEDGITGYTFPFADVEELADRMLRCARDRPSLWAMGQRAKKRVLRDYSVEKAVQGTVAALKSLSLGC